MRLTRSTVRLFGFYTVLFVALLFARQTAYSPVSDMPKHETSENTSSEFHGELTSEGISKRAEVIDRLESAPLKPAYEIVLRTDRYHSNELKSLVETTLGATALNEKVTPISVELTDDRSEPRGQTTDVGVSMTVTIPTESEFLKVFVHELGHIVDLHFLKAGTFTSDPSDQFYGYSWVEYNQKKKGVTVNDFVSGYALTNKYEDFAESFAFYVFHNDEFRKRATKSQALALKYNFLAEKVFVSAEFQGTSFEKQSIASYIWDTTKIDINTKKYLFYLR